MCGIFFALYSDKNEDFDISRVDFELLKKRGPNSFDQKTVSIDENVTCHFAGSVLSLRGGSEDQVTCQPIYDSENGNLLLWNGEIFESGLVNVGSHENDGHKLLRTLGQKEGEQHILDVFGSIHGPYAFVFYKKRTQNVYFGRDRLGRRSLLISALKNTFLLSSVRVKYNTDSNNNEFEELLSNGIYKLDLKQPIENLTLFEWKHDPLTLTPLLDQLYTLKIKTSNLSVFDSIKPFNDNIEPTTTTTTHNNTVDELFRVLKESVMRRVKPLPDFCKSCSTLKGLTKFACTAENSQCNHSKLAILFSGGLDSTVLAALADLCLPENESIDLLNIAFEKPKTNNVQKSKHKQQVAKPEEEFLVPDRISGIASLKELNPKRQWNFVEINVTLDELKKERDLVIRDLLYPHQTVLDDSIGCALWFASRGQGILSRIIDSKLTVIDEKYTSTAEVLMLGMGADEQLAGYARHRSCFERDGLRGLCEEVKMEMKRISERNLGRDDRILSDHGKESRLPYLDETLVSFLNELPIEHKCDMKQPRGYGEKYLLRKLASSRLGLEYSACLPKRAIQFGSRVAKIENNKEKAADVCERLANNLNISED